MPSSVVFLPIWGLGGSINILVFRKCILYNFKRMLSHRPFFQGNSCNCKMKSQLYFLPSSCNIHSMCRSKNRAAVSLCGSHLHFCNLRHMFQRTGVFFWPSDLGDNSHGWKLLMASLNQHCKQIVVVVVFRLFLVLEPV